MNAMSARRLVPLTMRHRTPRLHDQLDEPRSDLVEDTLQGTRCRPPSADNGQAQARTPA
ncbi:hypothetical protein [Streptomyces sp. NPDC060022]|uniref:hypothetical protein n=1 Tax=Streptomyces sp. NPDC060022 TaxID=3347039 RepID=UPI0036CAC4BC